MDFIFKLLFLLRYSSRLNISYRILKLPVAKKFNKEVKTTFSVKCLAFFSPLTWFQTPCPRSRGHRAWSCGAWSATWRRRHAASGSRYRSFPAWAAPVTKWKFNLYTEEHLIRVSEKRKKIKTVCIIQKSLYWKSINNFKKEMLKIIIKSPTQLSVPSFLRTDCKINYSEPKIYHLSHLTKLTW